MRVFIAILPLAVGTVRWVRVGEQVMRLSNTQVRSGICNSLKAAEGATCSHVSRKIRSCPSLITAERKNLRFINVKQESYTTHCLLWQI